MAIFGIGVDVVETPRFNNINPETLAQKILSSEEFPAFESSNNKILFLAKRFSVKEAVSKAFGVGIGKKLTFKDISIFKDERGKPLCTVNETAVHIITGRKNIKIHISTSDSSSTIQSYAIAEIID